MKLESSPRRQSGRKMDTTESTTAMSKSASTRRREWNLVRPRTVVFPDKGFAKLTIIAREKYFARQKKNSKLNKGDFREENLSPRRT